MPIERREFLVVACDECAKKFSHDPEISAFAVYDSQADVEEGLADEAAHCNYEGWVLLRSVRDRRKRATPRIVCPEDKCRAPYLKDHALWRGFDTASRNRWEELVDLYEDSRDDA